MRHSYRSAMAVLLLGAGIQPLAAQAAQTAVGYPIYIGINTGGDLSDFRSGVSALAADASGNYFGANLNTANGANEPVAGQLFKVTSTGSYSTLYTFSTPDSVTNTNTDGVDPESVLIGSNGALYGAAASGGSANAGTLFTYSGGTFNVLHTFSGTGSDGGSPTCLIAGLDGNFYGSTTTGGTNNKGTLFKLTPAGAFTTLYSFATTNAGTSFTNTCPVVDAQGNLYGMVSLTGVPGFFGTETSGVYQYTPSGTYSILHKLSATGIIIDSLPVSIFFVVGTVPDATSSLAVGSDGYIYGVQDYFLGTANLPELYRISTSGSFAVASTSSVHQGVQLLADKAGGVYVWSRAGTEITAYTPKSASSSSYTSQVIYDFAGYYSQPGPDNAWITDGQYPHAVTLDQTGNLAAAAGTTTGSDATPVDQIDRIVLAGDMTGTASVTPSQAAAGATVTAQWNFTGASDCELLGEVPDSSKVGSIASSGSLSMVVSADSPTGNMNFAAQCHDSQGGTIRIPVVLDLTS